MYRRMRPRVIGLFICMLGAVTVQSAAAGATSDEINKHLLEVRDEVKTPLTTWQAAVTKKTSDEFDSVKTKLPETWKEGREKAFADAVAKLSARRQAITDPLVGDSERLDRVSRSLLEQFDGLAQALKEAGVKFDADAAAFQVPEGSDAKEKSLEKLAELMKAALAPVTDTEWLRMFKSVNAAFADPTTEEEDTAANEEVKRAAASVQKFVDAVERDFERVVRCTFTEKTGTLVCDRALAVSAAEISTIEISGLPHGRRVTVSARAAKDAPSQEMNGKVDPESDFVVLMPGQADKVSIDVHLRRAFNATYKEGFKHSKEPENEDERIRAAKSLREAREGLGLPRRSLVLIVSGRAPQIIVQVKVGEGTRTGELVTASLELGYARWGVDTGGFFAVATLSDEQLETEPTGSTDEPNMVTIKRRGGGSDLSEDTGIFLNLVPKNYPIFGLGIGFSANKDQPNTFYFGPSVRLLSFRNRGVASFSLGGTVRSVKRFPGLDEGMKVSASDPRLEGKNQLKVAPYIIIQLGFSFGRIPGASD